MSPFPIILLAIVGYSLGISAHKSFTTHQAEVFSVVRAWRWRYFPGTLAALFGVGLVAVTLEALLPWTSWGWWHLLGGRGNPVLGEVNLGSGVYALGVSTLLAISFPILFAAAAIREARREEVDYRKGNQKRTLAWRIRRALWFGIIHSISGIPISAGVGISVMGAWFDFVYQRGYEHAVKQMAQTEAQSQPLSMLQPHNALVAIPVASGESSPQTAQWSMLQEWATQTVTATDKTECEAMIQMMRGENAVRGDFMAVLRARMLSLAVNGGTLNSRAEEAGVNAAAAQHAAINLLLIVLIECFVLSQLGVF